MTPWFSPVSHSPEGETFTSSALSLPPSLQSLLPSNLLSSDLATLASAKASSSLRSLPPPPDWLTNASPATLVVALLACALVALTMSWHSPITSLFGRRTPSSGHYTTVSNPPHVSESDYSYISPDDIVDPPSRAGHGGRYAGADDSDPDTVLLKHRKNTYELHFPAYAINDGALTVGQLRQRAAEATQTPDPKRVVLLYKGKVLDEDSVACRNEGLKQQSEVLCVVSEVQPGETSDGSDTGRTNDSSVSGSVQEPSAGRRRNRNRNKNKKKSNKKNNKKDNKDEEDDEEPVAPSASASAPAPATPATRSAMPAPSPPLHAFKTPMAQVNALLGYLRDEMLPRVDDYIHRTPADPKAREFEHSKLSEVILAQVILKADGIEPIDEETRNARRALIKEAQRTLNSLDQVAKDMQ